MPVHITIKYCPLSNLWSACNLSEWTFTSCCLQLAFVTRAYQEKSSSSYSFCCCGDDVLLPFNFPLPYSFDLNSLLSPADHVGARVKLYLSTSPSCCCLCPCPDTFPLCHLPPPRPAPPPPQVRVICYLPNHFPLALLLITPDKITPAVAFCSARPP